jgi:hypothetical protein
VLLRLGCGETGEPGLAGIIELCRYIGLCSVVTDGMECHMITHGTTWQESSVGCNLWKKDIVTHVGFDKSSVFCVNMISGHLGKMLGFHSS